MRTAEQQARINELLELDDLTPEQEAELKELQAIPEDSEAEFNAAWDDLEGKTTFDDDDEASQEDKEDKPESSAQSDTGSDSGDGDQSSVPAGMPDGQANAGDSTPDPRDAKIAELEQRMRSWEGRIKAADQRAAEAEAKLKEMEQAEKAKEQSGSTSLQDDPELSEFFKEFPDLEAPIKKVAEKVANKIVQEKLTIVEEVAAQHKKTQETLQEEADRRHYETIEAAHPDWKTIYESGALEEWVKRQPSFLQPRYQQIIKSGEAREIVDMFSAYKRAAGKTQSTTNNSSALSGDKVARAKAMEAVPAQPGGPTPPKVQPKKDDFDGAWDYWTKQDEIREKRRR